MSVVARGLAQGGKALADLPYHLPPVPARRSTLGACAAARRDEDSTHPSSRWRLALPRCLPVQTRDRPAVRRTIPRSPWNGRAGRLILPRKSGRGQTAIRSMSAGDLQPIAECGRRELYNPKTQNPCDGDRWLRGSCRLSLAPLVRTDRSRLGGNRAARRGLGAVPATRGLDRCRPGASGLDAGCRDMRDDAVGVSAFGVGNGPRRASIASRRQAD